MGDVEMLKQMGERIYEKRKTLKYTQEQLAEKLGVSTQMISNLELGKKAIRPENLVKLCGVLGLSADYLLTGTVSDCCPLPICEKIGNLTLEEQEIIENLVDYMCKK